MTLTLSKTETTILLEAAGRPDGTIVMPSRLKPASQERTITRLVGAKLIEPGEASNYVLVAAGYRAVGLRPPRRQVVGAIQTEPRGTKQQLILDLLVRDDGASLTELAAATGWLPHTTRAALSRLRSAGKTLIRRKRPTGGFAYTIGEPAVTPEAA